MCIWPDQQVHADTSAVLFGDGFCVWNTGKHCLQSTNVNRKKEPSFAVPFNRAVHEAPSKSVSLMTACRILSESQGICPPGLICGTAESEDHRENEGEEIQSQTIQDVVAEGE